MKKMVIKIGVKEDFPVYFPNKFLKLGKTFTKKVNKFFSYKIINLLPDKNNINYIKRIIEFGYCVNFKHKLYYTNCFNLNNFRVTLIRVCHVCQIMYILSGRFSGKITYDKAFSFFNELSRKNILDEEQIENKINKEWDKSIILDAIAKRKTKEKEYLRRIGIY